MFVSTNISQQTVGSNSHQVLDHSLCVWHIMTPDSGTQTRQSQPFTDTGQSIFSLTQTNPYMWLLKTDVQYMRNILWKAVWRIAFPLCFPPWFTIVRPFTEWIQEMINVVYSWTQFKWGFIIPHNLRDILPFEADLISGKTSWSPGFKSKANYMFAHATLAGFYQSLSQTFQ